MKHPETQSASDLLDIGMVIICTSGNISAGITQLTEQSVSYYCVAVVIRRQTSMLVIHVVYCGSRLP